MAVCCSCNGKNAVGKRCAFVRAGRPCTSGLPLKFQRCNYYNLPSNASLLSDLNMVRDLNDQFDTHMSAVSSMDNNKARWTLLTGYDSFVNVDNVKAQN